MDAKIENYLRELEASDVLKRRVEEVMDFYEKALLEKIDDIFISEYIKEDNTRVFQSLWLFNQNYCFEAKEFMEKDDFDFCPIKNRIGYWKIQKTNYVIGSASEKSRQSIVFHLEMALRVNGELKASKKNCDFLTELFMKYFHSNIIK